MFSRLRMGRAQVCAKTELDEVYCWAAYWEMPFRLPGGTESPGSRAHQNGICI